MIPIGSRVVAEVEGCLLQKVRSSDVGQKPRTPKSMPRFSKELEIKLDSAGWYEGRNSREALEQLDFELHLRGKQFLLEFGGLAIASILFSDAYYINLIYNSRRRIQEVGLPNCLPVAASWYWCEGELWMDEVGRLYQVGGYEMVRVGEGIEEALELLVLRKPFPENLQRWEIEEDEY